MSRYQATTHALGLALIFVFSSVQADNAHGFRIKGVGWTSTASSSGPVGFDFGTPIIGHTLGLRHVASGNANFLLRTSLSRAFDGPQLDEILGVQRLYGDVNEQNGGNDTYLTATPLGTLRVGTPLAIGTDGDSTVVAFTDVDFVSIDGDHGFNGSEDIDEFSFNITSPSIVDIRLTPKGPTCRVGPPDASQQLYNASAQNDLSLELLDINGIASLDFSDSTGLGESEEIFNFQLNTPGEYFVRVRGVTPRAIQLFQLDLVATAVPEPTSIALLAAAILCFRSTRRSRRPESVGGNSRLRRAE